MWTWWRRFWGERVQPPTPPVRWALIYTGQFEMVVIRRITEDRIPSWEAFGWTVLIRDSDVWFEGLDDVYRQEKERGTR